MKNILVICGPTASGKTSLALKVAKEIVRAHHDAPDNVATPTVHILSADSRQIYRGIDIVTGKDLPEDLPKSIQFFGLDLVDPDQSFNLSDYVNYAKKVILQSIEEGIPLIIVGGTGLYLKAITSDLLDVHVPPNPELRVELEKLDLATLKKQLAKINPAKYSSLNNSDANNPRRLIRAIEISIYTPSLRDSYSNQSNPFLLDRCASPRLPEGQVAMMNTSFHWVGLKQDKESQAKNIRQRVIARLEEGAIQEVESLKKRFSHYNTSLFTSLGVQEISMYLDQTITYEQLVDSWITAEKDYARRQMVWFTKVPEIVWYDIATLDPDLVANLVKLITTK